MLGIKVDKLSQLISHPFDNMFTFVDGLDDRLREDYFLKNILLMTTIFKKRRGILSEDVVEVEGALYLSLMQEYLKALVSGGHCVERCDEILYNIHITQERLSTMIPLYEKVAVAANNSPSMMSRAFDESCKTTIGVA